MTRELSSHQFSTSFQLAPAFLPFSRPRSLLFFVTIFSLQLPSMFDWRVPAPPVGSSMRTLRTSTGRPQCGDNLSHPCHPTEPKKNGPIGDICKDFVRGGTCMGQRHAIGRDGSLRRFWLGARRKVFTSSDRAPNFNAF